MVVGKEALGGRKEWRPLRVDQTGQREIGTWRRYCLYSWEGNVIRTSIHAAPLRFGRCAVLCILADLKYKETLKGKTVPERLWHHHTPAVALPLGPVGIDTAFEQRMERQDGHRIASVVDQHQPLNEISEWPVRLLVLYFYDRKVA